MIINSNSLARDLANQGRTLPPQGDGVAFAQQMSATETAQQSSSTRSCFFDETGNEVLHDGGYTITISGEGGGSFSRSESYSSAHPVYNVTSFFKGYAQPCLGQDYSWSGQINVKNIDLNNASAIEMETLRLHLGLNVNIPSEYDQRLEQNYVEVLESEVARLEEEGEWKLAQDCQSALDQMIAYIGTVYQPSDGQSMAKTVENPAETQGTASGIPLGQPKEDSELDALKNQLTAMIENNYDRARLETMDEEEDEQERFESLLDMVDKAIEEIPDQTLAEEQWKLW